jgi:hypothetical protein
VRHGFDLEPALPDPAPAYHDPEGAFHPALTEPLTALTLHRFPTAASRSAMTARLLSEPGRPHLDDPEDPFVAVYRFAARSDMEPEVTGSLALLLLRERIAQVAREHREPMPDPAEALRNPDLDVFRRRRARLRDADWDSLWMEIEAASSFTAEDPALDFERENLRASSRWLADYRAWWAVAGLLGDDEQLPMELGPLRAALAGFDDRLDEAIRSGCRAEAAFVAEVGVQPDGHVSARWLLARQVGALRDLGRSTRDRSLSLHRLLRTCDVARVRAQLAYRALALRLWTDDESERVEEELIGLPDPPHPTTLGAGLGRLLGMVLLRRLRRGDDRAAQALAERALTLAPEELAIRLTWNDLRFHRRGRDGVLLRSLREERQRWDSVSVCAMGARVAEEQGEISVARRFRDRLAARGLELGTASGWLLAVAETLGDPAALADRDHLDALVSAQRPLQGLDDPLAFIVLGEGDRAVAASDHELGLLEAIADLETAAGLEGAPLPGGRRRRRPAWRQLVGKPLPDPSHGSFCGRLFGRLQELRAAAPSLRQPPLAGQLRGLSRELASAADLGVSASAEMGLVVPTLGEHLAGPTEAGAVELASWLEGLRDPLRVALRAPRGGLLGEELSRLTVRVRVAGRADLLEVASRIRADLADPQSDLDGLAQRLAVLAAGLEPPAVEVAEPGLMRLHPEFDAFSRDELGIQPEALRRARDLVRLFNLSGGRRDRKRLKGKTARSLFELRHRTARMGGLRVFYRRDAGGWLALAAMSKYDDRQQQEAIDRVVGYFEG